MGSLYCSQFIIDVFPEEESCGYHLQYFLSFSGGRNQFFHLSKVYVWFLGLGKYPEDAHTMLKPVHTTYFCCFLQKNVWVKGV